MRRTTGWLGLSLLGTCAAAGSVPAFAQEFLGGEVIIDGSIIPGSIEVIDAASADRTAADQAYRAGNFPLAIELADRVLAANAGDHVATFLRASARVELGVQKRDRSLLRDGIRDAREALRLEGRGKAEYYLPYLFGMTNLAIVEQRPDHAETARTIATQTLDRGGLSTLQQANLLYQRGLADVQAGAADAARDDLNQAIQLKPDHLAAYMALCDLTNRTAGRDEALAVFHRAAAALPDNPLVLNNRGMHLQSMGRSAEALADFDRALTLDSLFRPAVINRGYTRLQSGDYSGAEADLTRAIELDPGAVQPYNLRGTARINLGRAAEAVADYQKVCELNPQNGMARADLGFAWFFAEDYARALAEFDQALTLDEKIGFLTPWRFAAGIRCGQDLAQDPAVLQAAMRPADERTWFDWLTLHQLGQVNDNDLLAAAAPADSPVHAAQMCEAYYFIGLDKSRREQPDEARVFFEQAVQTEAERLSAFRGARYALRDFDNASAATN